MARIHVTTGLLDTIILSRLLGRTDAEIAAELCEMLGRNVSRPRVQEYATVRSAKIEFLKYMRVSRLCLR